MTNVADNSAAETTISLAMTSEVELVRSLLRQVIDPEVGVNIVDLGLVYRIDTGSEPMRVEMTMTSPACPMGEMIVDEVRATLAGRAPGGDAANVILVWEPPWNPSMMTNSAKLSLGWTA